MVMSGSETLAAIVWKTTSTSVRQAERRSGVEHVSDIELDVGRAGGFPGGGGGSVGLRLCKTAIVRNLVRGNDVTLEMGDLAE
jgi:hypothetical protein